MNDRVEAKTKTIKQQAKCVDCFTLKWMFSNRSVVDLGTHFN